MDCFKFKVELTIEQLKILKKEDSSNIVELYFEELEILRQKGFPPPNTLSVVDFLSSDIDFEIEFLE